MRKIYLHIIFHGISKVMIVKKFLNLFNARKNKPKRTNL